MNLYALDKLLPFHEWKEIRIKKDGVHHEKFWYYQAYGNYCLKFRRMKGHR